MGKGIQRSSLRSLAHARFGILFSIILVNFVQVGFAGGIPLALLERAKAFFKSGEYGEAVAVCDEIETRNIADLPPAFWAKFGKSLFMAGDYVRAREKLELFLQKAEKDDSFIAEAKGLLAEIKKNPSRQADGCSVNCVNRFEIARILSHFD